MSVLLHWYCRCPVGSSLFKNFSYKPPCTLHPPPPPRKPLRYNRSRRNEASPSLLWREPGGGPISLNDIRCPPVTRPVPMLFTFPHHPCWFYLECSIPMRRYSLYKKVFLIFQLFAKPTPTLPFSSLLGVADWGRTTRILRHGLSSFSEKRRGSLFPRVSCLRLDPH